MKTVILNSLVATFIILVFLANMYLGIAHHSWFNAVIAGYMIGAFHHFLVVR